MNNFKQQLLIYSYSFLILAKPLSSGNYLIVNIVFKPSSVCSLWERIFLECFVILSDQQFFECMTSLRKVWRSHLRWREILLTSWWDITVKCVLSTPYIYVIYGFCCQKQVSQAGICNCTPQYSVGWNYLFELEIPASGNKVLIETN